LTEAAGRVLAKDVLAAADLPLFDRAAADGLALRAEETAGASPYNPLSFGLGAAEISHPPSTIVPVNAGDALPAGADAIMPIEHIEKATGSWEIIYAVAPGSGVERRGSHFLKGDTLLKAGRHLLPHRIGLLASAGVRQIRTVRRPRVICVLLAQSKRTAEAALHDANGPLLLALL